MTTNKKWLLGIIIAFFVLVGAVGVITVLIVSLGGEEMTFTGGFGDRVGVIEVSGVIENSRETVSQIRKMAEDKRVKAVVVRVESPGGAVAPSQEIYQALNKLRTQDSIPVIVSMGTVAASGGYYIACAADSVLAMPGTLTGSIGVILQFPDLQEVFRKVGIGMKTIKSGEHKDLGSPFRDMSDSEREILQEMVDDVYDQFVEVVAEGRGLDEDSVRAVADGRIFSGRQALELGLVDRTGSYRDALTVAGRMCGLGDDPKTIKLKKAKPSLFDILTEIAAKLGDPAGQINALSSPRLLYLFR
ncbi:MAG: signal peptide peptidase SppA [Candidatus Glassbacteria bacterium]|nr:signal peptide peptidase SppA [Candidatus Glassbacteria bacterium]